LQLRARSLDPESSGFKIFFQRASVITLNFNIAIANGPAAATTGFEFSCHDFECHGVQRELFDHRHFFAASAFSFKAYSYHAIANRLRRVNLVAVALGDRILTVWTQSAGTG